MTTIRQQNKNILRAIFCVTLFTLTANAHALQAVRAQHNIHLDGKLDDIDWQRAPVMDKWVENMPNEKAEPRVKTEVRVLYDQSAIYFGVKAYDPDVSKLRAPFVRRDRVFSSADNIIVYVDPTGARKFAQFFRVNARSVIADGSWNDDTSTEDFSPDYEYEALSFVGTDHWSAEFRIPWSSLRIPHPVPEKLTFIVFRNMPRETRIRMSTAVLGREPSCFLCVADELTGIVDVPKSSGLTLMPYLSGISTKDKVGASTASQSKLNAGIDVKWRPSSEWVLDATLRPDFSQLELDKPQLSSNTRFALFSQEKRPFFLEGTDLYLMPDASVNTRSISDPVWGARATYRSESLDATAITVADRGGGFTVLPNTYSSDGKPQSKSQTTLARLRMPYAYAGGGSLGLLLSDREYESGSSNRVASLDLNHKATDAIRLRSQVMASRTYDDGVTTTGHYAYLGGTLERGLQRTYLNYTEVAPNFRFDNSFLGQSGYRAAHAELQHCINRKAAFFDNVCPTLSYRESRSWNNVPLQRTALPSLYMNGARNSEWNVQPRFANYQRTREGGLWHHTPTVYAMVSANPIESISLASIEAEVGRGVDVATDSLVKQSSITLSLKFRPVERIELEASTADFRLFNLEDHRWRLLERNVSLLGIGHISSQDTLRLIAQYGLSKRNPTVYNVPVNQRTQSQTFSLVYAHMRGLGREFNIGVTQRDVDKSGQTKATTTEVFAKAMWAFSM